MWAHVPAACVARRAGDAGSLPHLLSVWGSLGTLRCAQLTPRAALGHFITILLVIPGYILFA
jgi:hypothetical protein